jgi:putative oxidoreductase
MLLDILSQLRRFALDGLGRLSFAPALLARLVIGVIFVHSGWGKLHNLDQVIEFFTSLGIPAPQIQAPFVAGTELVCGALVLVGLGTRIFAVPLIGTMVVAIATALWPDIEGVNGLFATVEFCYIALLVQLIVYGPGAVSVDALVSRAIAGREAPLHRHAGAQGVARA